VVSEALKDLLKSYARTYGLLLIPQFEIASAA